MPDQVPSAPDLHASSLQKPRGPTLRQTAPKSATSPFQTPIWLPYFVLAVSLLLTITAVFYLRRSGEARERLRFQGLVQTVQQSIEDRLETHMALLRATLGLIDTSETVSRREFRVFVDRLEIRRHYPGIQGIGYIAMVPARDRVAFITRVRREEGLQGFDIRPAGAGENSAPVLYVEPEDERNRAPVGFDMLSEPIRRMALERARDTGGWVNSGRVTLLQEIEEKKQSGFLVLFPIYEGIQIPQSVEARRSLLQGFVYGAFRAGDLLTDISGSAGVSGIAYRVFAGVGEDEHQLLHDSAPGSERVRSRENLTEKRVFGVAGHPWTVSFAALPGFEEGQAFGSPMYMAVIGTMISLLLFGIARAQGRARESAEQIAAELRVSEAALRESEEQYRELFMRSPEAVVIQVDGRYVSVNSAFVKLLGASAADELIGRSVLEFVHRDHLDVVRERLRAMDNERKVLPPIEEKRVRLDGTVIDVEVTSSPVTYLGRPGAQVILRDVSVRKSLEAQLRQSQKMEAVGRLAGGVAHDFNNILTAILGYSDFLISRLEHHGALRHFAEEISKAGNRAATLTGQLLAFGRKQMLQPRVLDLNEVVADMQSMLRRLIGEDIELVTVLQPDLGRVTADPGQIEQVLLNVVVNSRDAMPRGGRLTLETMNTELDESYCRTHPDVSPGAYVLLAVSDSGLGMDRDTQQQIFEPFFTTKEPGKGTGLGLSMVYGIVRQSGGHVAVYSEPGYGATFKIYLPRVEVPVGVLRPVQVVEKVVGGNETILVVEDEAMVREIMREILHQWGYRVLEAASGEQALEQIAASPETIHLLLTDVVMKGMGGLELAERVTVMRPGMRVLFVSGYTDRSLSGLSGARAAFLGKPFTPEDLARRVRALLDLPDRELQS